MTLTKTHKIIISIIAVVILLGIYIALDRRSRRESNNNVDTSQTVATSTDTTTNSNGQIKTQGTGNYTIEQVPLSEGKGVPQPIPDLNREPVLYTGAIISPEAKTLAVEKIKSLQTQLKTKSADLPAWLDLGMYQKQVGDYDGAILSWKYASKLAPTDYISLGNLGNLYAYFLKDNGFAEVYYKQAILKGPTQAYLYTQLAEIYRDIFKDLDKARALINQGLSKIPNNPSLLQFQEGLK